MDNMSDLLSNLNLNKKYNIKEEERIIDFLPNTFRCVVNGPSGCGKTNLVLNLLLKIFESYRAINRKIKLIICSKTTDQDLYQCFIQDVKEQYKNFHSISLSNSISDFNDDFYSSLDKNVKHIILIDDMLGKMNKEDIKSLVHLFSSSRPRKISLFFLTQRYTKIEISCRRNCNYLITFKPSLEEAHTICCELLEGLISSPALLIKKLSKNNFFSLFFDLEKLTFKSVFEIFNCNKTFVYESLNSLVERLMLIVNEMIAGNDSKALKEEIDTLFLELEKKNIINLL